MSGERIRTEIEHGEGEEHPPYTDETIKRAITQGVEPDGEPLEHERGRPERSAGIPEKSAVTWGTRCNSGT